MKNHVPASVFTAATERQLRAEGLREQGQPGACHSGPPGGGGGGGAAGNNYSCPILSPLQRKYTC